jgi:hypothetical protein
MFCHYGFTDRQSRNFNRRNISLYKICLWVYVMSPNKSTSHFILRSLSYKYPSNPVNAALSDVIPVSLVIDTQPLHKTVFRQMYTLYYLLFNTVGIKNSPVCFEPCHSSSSGTQLFITPAIYIWYLLKYISWFDKMPLTVLSFGH